MEIPDSVNGLSKMSKMASTSIKMFVVGFLVLVCWIGSFFVSSLVSERSSRQIEAENEVATEWGRPELVAGPVLTIPYSLPVRGLNGGITSFTSSRIYVLPHTLNVDGDLTPEVRERGIFRVPVYKGKLTLTGNIKVPSTAELKLPAGSIVDWNNASLAIGLADVRGLGQGTEVLLDNKSLNLLAGSPDFAVDGSGVHTQSVVIVPGSTNEFSVKIALAGSQGIRFVPLGSESQVTLRAPWSSPSFFGAFLPDEESITKDGFTASWHVSALGRSYPEVFTAPENSMNITSNSYYNSENNQGIIYKFSPTDIATLEGGATGETLGASAFGVNLFREVTFYTLVERTVKYAILFIALTFLSFFLFEVVSKIKIHPFQYILIGAALVLFYLLLLSFAEYLGFGLAYLLAAIMTLGLVTAYSASVLGARKRASTIAAILAVLYGYLYAILQLEQFALLFGTLFLFLALAVVMRTTRKINWYSN